MKTLATLLIATALSIALTACGCSNNLMNDTTSPVDTIIPESMPTIETNIPDPDVDTEMPIYTEDATEPDTSYPGTANTEINK